MPIRDINAFVDCLLSEQSAVDATLHEAVRILLTLPESERFEFIIALAKHPEMALRPRIPSYLSQRCLVRPHYLLELLKYGISRSDASRIRVWIRYLTPMVGFVRVARFLERHIEIEPLGVVKSLYWLQLLMPPQNKRAKAAMDDLLSAARQANVIRLIDQ